MLVRDCFSDEGQGPGAMFVSWHSASPVTNLFSAAWFLASRVLGKRVSLTEILAIAGMTLPSP